MSTLTLVSNKGCVSPACRSIAFLTWRENRNFCKVFTLVTGQVSRSLRWQSIAFGDRHPHTAAYSLKNLFCWVDAFTHALVFFTGLEARDIGETFRA